MRLTVEYPVRDEGSVVVLLGTDDNDEQWLFAADHRPAQAIIEALEADEPVEVEVESWQLLGGPHGSGPA